MTTTLKRLAVGAAAAVAIPAAILAAPAAHASATVTSAALCSVQEEVFPSGDNAVIMTSLLNGEKYEVQVDTVSTFPTYSGYLSVWTQLPGQRSWALAGGTPVGEFSDISVSSFTIGITYSFAEQRWTGEVFYGTCIWALPQFTL